MAERRATRTGSSRLRPLVPLASIWSVGCVLLIGLVAQRRVPYDRLLLDPNGLNNVPWYTGLVSNLGILGWTTAVATGCLGAWIAHYGRRPAAAALLGRGAALSTMLLLDDLFQLHVAVKPLLGITKPAVYLCYLVVAAWWAVTQRHELRRTRTELLLASVAAFGASIVVDQLGAATPWLDARSALVVEDAAKFLGVLAWAQYFVLTAGDVIKSILNQGVATAHGPAGPYRRARGIEEPKSDLTGSGRYHDRSAKTSPDQATGRPR